MTKWVGIEARSVTAALVVAGGLMGCGVPSVPRIPMAADAGPVGEWPESEPPGAPEPSPPSEPEAPIVRAPDAMLLASDTVFSGLESGLVTADGSGGWQWSLTVSRCALTPLEGTLLDPGERSCARFAQEAFEDRSHRPLEVPAGWHTIALTNTHEAWRGDAGLWIRALDTPSATALTAGGAAPGRTVSYRVALSPGVYRISDPVSPTPDYLLVVTP